MRKEEATGEDLKSIGMSAAARSAGREWMDDAMRHTLLVGSMSTDGTFTAEDVREMSAGFLGEPPSLKSWGAVMATLARRGVIRRVGFVKARSKTVHSMYVTLWKLVGDEKEQ